MQHGLSGVGRNFKFTAFALFPVDRSIASEGSHFKGIPPRWEVYFCAPVASWLAILRVGVGVVVCR